MQQFAGYILDLDGTVYRGGRLIAGAAEAIARLRQHGARIAFLSNNPTRGAAQYAAKLTALGVPATPDDILTSSQVLIRELTREAPGASLLVVAEPVLEKALREAGFSLDGSPEEAQFVVLSFDRTFHYGKLRAAYRAVKAGARLWATNPDRACPTEEGETPDCAAIIAAVEACTGATLERCAGKPSTAILEEAARRMGLPLDRCLTVGDRLETDILMARNAGCCSALVLTGVTPREALTQSDIQPDFVLESIAEL